MKILAIETATEACSAAILLEGRCLERYRLAPREHNRLILPMIDELLAEAGITVSQLDAIAFGRGPGSFTGVRIATGVAQGIALGADLPVIPVSTLAALALDAMDREKTGYVYACIDARMDEVYWGVYGREGMRDELRLVGEEAVTSAQKVRVPTGLSGVGAGSGWGTYREILSERVGKGLNMVIADRFPRAAAMARLAAVDYRKGRAVSPEQALPVYLRNNVANKPAAQT
jgi:tRNA threonylcarbamoyladenosine biosynthesis protein TsaB